MLLADNNQGVINEQHHLSKSGADNDLRARPAVQRVVLAQIGETGDDRTCRTSSISTAAARLVG